MSLSFVRLVVATSALFAGSSGIPAFAQSSKYAKGDRVEVEDGFEWKKGTVVSANSRTGWIEVRIDESEEEHARNVPKSVRATMLTRSYPPGDVRPLAEAKEDRPRKWTDRTGKFSVTARYGGVEGDSVILIRSGGKQVKVPLARLSEEDQLYVKTQNQPDQNPFGEPDVREVAAAVRKKADWHDVREVQPKSFDEWSFAPAGTTAQRPAAPLGRNIDVRLNDIPDSQKFFEDIEGIFVSQDGNQIFVCRNKGTVSQDKQRYLDEVDAARERGKALIALPETTAVLDVEPDQRLVMYRPDIFGNGENGVLTIARLDGDTLTPVIEWEPYADEDFPPRRDIEKAYFLSADRVMTINGHGKMLTVWDAKAAKALFNIPVGVSFTLKMSLSPDRALLAVVMEKGVAIIDLLAGRHVATIDTIGREIQQVVIRADNTRLAAVFGYGVTVWDLTSGKELTSFAGMGTGSHRSLAWVGQYLLAESQYLYDVERRILLWEYQGDPRSAEAATMRNGRLYVIPKTWNDGDETKLVSAALPHRSPREMAARLPSPDKLLVVKPGDEVQLEVDIDPSVAMPSEVEQQLTARLQNANLGGADAGKIVFLQQNAAQGDLIRQALTAALLEAGFKVVDKSKLVVKAICKPQPQQTIRVNVDGRWPPRPEDFQERMITPHASYLEMTLNDELLWKRGFVARPHMTIWLKQGESLDQALARYTQPNFAIFTHAMFSPYVAKPGKATPNGAYGVSQFTARGIVDGSSSVGGRVAFE